LQSAERADMRHGFCCRERNAIPHYATIRLAQQQRALTDRKGRLHPKTGKAEIVTPDDTVRLRQFLSREPALAVPVHELPLVLADRASGRRRAAFRKLRAALLTGPKRHRLLQSLSDRSLALRDTGRKPTEPFPSHRVADSRSCRDPGVNARLDLHPDTRVRWPHEGPT